MDASAYQEINNKVDRLIEGYQQAADKHSTILQINRAGSMVGVFFANEPVINYETASKSDTEAFSSYYRIMAEEGIFLPPISI
ncbi:glutamate-1-semialdehyde aminotransferase [Gracilibacillus boraciitolerans JCM 21714]|uniref:Glutamate-1-semialdehyde aminotransferase n=1 Tax=Gracilibacillus boraciitolerans JCM 21714 TaxID=1298598 RepID=W4VHK9_9BACI|nr:glutamate-1-semialdehyde aminotransferase [Gracilibacillus boraciitolerans JCM 21714]